jgi:hypothetical protein
MESGFVPNMSGNNHPFRINNNRLPKAKFPDRRSDRINSVVVDAGVTIVGNNGIDVSEFDLHDSALVKSRPIVYLTPVLTPVKDAVFFIRHFCCAT